MDEVTTIAAEHREGRGTGGARALRQSGRIPAVVYGDHKDNLHVSVDLRDLRREISRGGFANRLYDLDVGGEKHRVLPREIQLHPVTDRPIHIDFLRLGASAEVRLMVPMVFTDDEKSPGIKRGGVLNVVRHEIELLCRAYAIPESITTSIAGLDIGDGVHINDIALPEGTSPTITDRNFTIATIAAPTVQVEEEVEEEEIEGKEGEEGEIPEGEEGAAEDGAEAATEGGRDENKDK